jgi:proteasome lid subunit RPN8/RPN11
MPDRTPAEILLGRQALTLIHRLLDAAEPEEGCALLLGFRSPAADASDPGPGRPGRCVWLLRHVWPCRNAWEPEAERGRRFMVDPREQLHAIRWARRHGLELLGSVHSHPLGAPSPSATDRAMAALPTLMLIRGLAADSPPDPAGQPRSVLSCWWLDPDATPLLLPWRMED